MGSDAGQGRRRVLDPRGPRADLPADDRRRADRPAAASTPAPPAVYLARSQSVERAAGLGGGAPRRRGGCRARSPWADVGPPRHQRAHGVDVALRHRLADTAAMRVSRSTAKVRPRDVAARRRGRVRARGWTASATANPASERNAAGREVVAPAAGRVAGADGEEEVGAVAVRLRRRGSRSSAPEASSSARRPRASSSSRTTVLASVSNPGATATKTRRPARWCGPRRSSSRSRTLATEPSARRPDAVERVEGRRRAADAVDGRPGVALELAQRRAVSSPRMPSSRPASKPRRVQPALELGDVVAAEHRAASVEQPVAEAKPLSTSAAQVCGPQMPSTRSPRALLEGAHGRARSRHRTMPALDALRSS